MAPRVSKISTHTTMETSAAMRTVHHTRKLRTCAMIATRKAMIKAGKNQIFAAFKMAGTVSREIEKHLMTRVTKHAEAIRPSMTTIPAIRVPEKIIAVTYAKRRAGDLIGPGP